MICSNIPRPRTRSLVGYRVSPTLYPVVCAWVVASLVQSGNFSGPTLKHFDVVLAPPLAWGEVPEAPDGIGLVPEKIASDWKRLYFSDDVRFPVAAALSQSECQSFLAQPRFSHLDNYWAETHRQEAVQLAVRDD